MGDIEKAAKKIVARLCATPEGFDVPELVAEFVGFATRHGAKVRRETLKEFVEAVKRSEDDLQRLTAEHPIHQDQCTIVSVIGRLQRVLKEIVLTPRGPEKGK